MGCGEMMGWGMEALGRGHSEEARHFEILHSAKPSLQVDAVLPRLPRRLIIPCPKNLK